MKIIYKDRIFKLGIYRDSIAIWDEKGTTSLGEIQYDKESTTFNEVYNYLHNIMDEYCKGLIHCSDCEKLIPMKDVAGHYFAGSYCRDCWERKWKEIEAKETYE